MNPIKNLITLRDQFNDRATQAMEIINQMTSSDLSFGNDFTWPLANGDYVTYTKTLDELAYYDSQGTWRGFTKVRVYLTTNPSMLELPIYQGASVCVNDILEEISNAMNFSASISNLCQQFCTRGYVTTSEIHDIVYEVSSYRNDELDKLLSNLRGLADENGKISSVAFMTLLSAIAKNSKDTIDDDVTWELDTTSPFAFKSFISTIIPSIVTAVSTVLVMIGNVVTVVIGAIGVLVGTVWNALASHVSSSLSIDIEGGTDYVKGPTLYTSSASTISGYSNLVLNKTLTIHETICGDVYAWHNVDNDYSSVNCFLRPLFNVEELGVIIRMCVSNYSDPDSGYVYKKTTQPDVDLIKTALLTEAQWAEVMADPSKVAKTLIADQAFRDFLGMSVDSLMDDSDHLFAKITHINVRLTNAKALVTLAMNSNLDFDHISDDIQIVQSIYTGVFQDFATNALNNQVLMHFYSPSMQVENIETYPVSPDYVGFTGTLLRNPFRLCFRLTGTSDLNCGVTSTSNEVGMFSSDNTDFIPQHRAIIIPDFTPEQVIKAVVITTVLATATAIIVGKIARRIAAWKAMKQTDRLSELNVLRQNYLDNKTPENAAVFKQGILSYNRRARFFGWGTYDAANGWMNASSASVSAILSSADTSSILSSVTSGNTQTSTSLSTVNGNVLAASGKIDTLQNNQTASFGNLGSDIAYNFGYTNNKLTDVGKLIKG